MMYNQKLAAAIKVNGKVLREFKDTVYVPFGSEYAITIKNLHTARAVVSVYIDGDNMVPGGLVLNAGQSIDLERSVKNNNLNEGNRFKFIERTGRIEQHRGIGVEDGLVRIEYQFEQSRPVINVAPVWTTTQTPWTNTPYYGATGSTASFNVNGVLRNVDTSKGETVRAMAAAATNATLSTMNISASSAEFHDGMATMDSFVNDVGITVPGSKSNQTFQTTTVGILETAIHNIVLKLVGDLGDNRPVEKPVTVKHKVKCTTCGRQNKHNAKFCTECGTALEVFA